MGGYLGGDLGGCLYLGTRDWGLGSIPGWLWGTCASATIALARERGGKGGAGV